MVSLPAAAAESTFADDALDEPGRVEHRLLRVAIARRELLREALAERPILVDGELRGEARADQRRHGHLDGHRLIDRLQ